MKGWVYLLIAIVSEVIGTSGLKASAEFTRLWPSLATIFAYCTSFFFLSLTLRTIPVGIAYAVWGGVGIVLITIVGWAYFGQRLDAPAILGMSLIIAGVVILNVFSKTVPHIPTTYFLGYDTDEDGKIVILEKEAEVVRRI